MASPRADRTRTVYWTRAGRPRPTIHHAPSYVCPRCDLILYDGVAYEICPICDAVVDWVDLRLAVWCCPGCDALVNAVVVSPPQCSQCARTYVNVVPFEKPSAGTEQHVLSAVQSFLETRVGVGLMLGATVSQALLLAADPQIRWLMIGQLIIALSLPALLFIGLIVEGSSLVRAFRQVASDPRIRVIHGIEHATAKLLAMRGGSVRDGESEHAFFKLRLTRLETKRGALPKDGGIGMVRRACDRAIRRLRAGESSLAIHPSCGTVWVAMLALAGAVSGAVLLIGLTMTLSFAWLAAAAAIAIGVIVLLSGPLGRLLQRALTVSTRFRRARVTRIQRVIEGAGVTCFIVYLDVEV